MNKDTIKGTWKQLKGTIREKWGNLTDDEVEVTKGNFEQLSGTIQKKYGQAKDQVNSDLKKVFSDGNCDESGFQHFDDSETNRCAG